MAGRANQIPNKVELHITQLGGNLRNHVLVFAGIVPRNGKQSYWIGFLSAFRIQIGWIRITTQIHDPYAITGKMAAQQPL